MKQAPHIPWTDAERLLLRRLRRQGVTLEAIAAALKRTRGSVQRQIVYLGLPKVEQRHAQHAEPEPTAAPQRAGRTTLPPLPSLQGDT